MMKINMDSATLIKWILLVVLSVGAGSFLYKNILDKLDINVWVSRSGGALTAVFTALMLYHLLKLGKKSITK